MLLSRFALCGSLLSLTAFAAPAEKPSAERSITVSGEAEVRVPPNQVQLWLAVESSDKLLAKAKADNDARVKKTLAALQKFGIEAKDMQTDFVTIEPHYENYSARMKDPDGYIVTKSVVVTLRDVGRFEALMQAVLDSGVNRVDGLEFRTTELRKHRDAARAMALKAAQEKASAMATELGLKTGKARNISEYGGWYGYGWGRGSRGGGMAQNVSQNIGGSGAEGSSEAGFAPGLISVRANVQVVFDME